ncbi:MAG: sigma-70 family RNA polymerase sigma factor [Limnochordaceae bacterium]|nr:sigma-70 family RNA polymerase sigma factor [Limnochordaceae bacterium]
MARRFDWAPVELEDRLQAARLGLVEASRRFDPALGVSFATYAVPLMLGEVRRLVEKSQAVAGVRGARALMRQAALAQQRLEAELGRPVTVQEVAQALGVEPAELAAADAALAPPVELEEPRAAPSDTSSDWSEHAAVRQALEKLSPGLRQVVWLRFFQGWSQQEVASALGISQPVVSRRERQALALLRRQLEQ